MYIPRPAKLLFTVDAGWNTFLEKFGDSVTPRTRLRCVYGEDAESALRFLFNAMAPKARSDFPFQGRPKMLYLDNGSVAKSHVFQNVMQSLKVD